MTLDPLVIELCKHHREDIPPALLGVIRKSAEKKLGIAKPAPKAEPRPLRDDFVPKVAEGVVVTSVPTLRWKLIVQEVAAKHDLQFADLMERSRKTKFAWPRQEAMYRMTIEVGMNRHAIAQKLGLDHTTVFHGLRAHAQRNGLPDPTGHKPKQ